jgi:hypothetical protein
VKSFAGTLGAMALYSLNIGGGAVLSELSIESELQEKLANKSVSLLLIADDQMYVHLGTKQENPGQVLKIPMTNVYCFKISNEVSRSTRSATKPCS